MSEPHHVIVYSDSATEVADVSSGTAREWRIDDEYRFECSCGAALASRDSGAVNAAAAAHSTAVVSQIPSVRLWRVPESHEVPALIRATQAGLRGEGYDPDWYEVVNDESAAQPEG